MFSKSYLCIFNTFVHVCNTKYQINFIIINNKFIFNLFVMQETIFYNLRFSKLYLFCVTADDHAADVRHPGHRPEYSRPNGYNDHSLSDARCF